MTLFEELAARGLVEATTSPEIEKLLENPQTVYCGFDPSAASLQAGNLVSIMMLRRLQLAGHRVIALVGGATGLIGDPSGKSAERNMLTVEKVEENKKGIRENLSRILDFDGPNAAVMVDNYEWYSGLSAIAFLRDIAVNFRVPQMLAKESVKKRLEASDGALTFTEFSYQILQGNDFLHLYDKYGCTMPQPFVFFGFLPRKRSDQEAVLAPYASIPATLVFFERKDRLQETLENACALLGPREVCVARELTKTHEEYLRFRLESIPDLSSLLGEVTVVVGPPEGNARTSREEVLAVIAEEQPLGGAPRAVARRVQARVRGWTTGEVYAILPRVK